MNTKTKIILVLLSAVFSLCGCNRMSEQFRRDASVVYELIRSAENGNTVMKADLEKALATAKADAQTDNERSAINAVDTYLLAWRVAGDSDLDRRLVEVCRWEAAKLLDREEPRLARPANLGDCGKLLTIRADRIIVENECEQSDHELSDLESKLKTATGDARASFRIISQREARRSVVVENCNKIADSKQPPLP